MRDQIHNLWTVYWIQLRDMNKVKMYNLLNRLSKRGMKVEFVGWFVKNLSQWRVKKKEFAYKYNIGLVVSDSCANGYFSGDDKLHSQEDYGKRNVDGIFLIVPKFLAVSRHLVPDCFGFVQKRSHRHEHLCICAILLAFVIFILNMVGTWLVSNSYSWIYTCYYFFC